MGSLEFNIRSLLRRLAPTPHHLLMTGCVLAMVGCGGGKSGRSILARPITVFLPVSTVVLAPGGSQVIIPIQIDSTSETALVNVAGLPGGVMVTYAASDTNPSGSLTFSAAAASMKGTFMPIVTVNSAGQSASTGFTLIVAAP